MEYPAIFHVARIYYPVLAAIGIPVNLLAILILCRGNYGLSKCVTRYLVAMAAADLMVIGVNVVLEQINYIYVYAEFLITTPTCALIIVVRAATTSCSVWFTVAFTFDRYIGICCQKLRNQYCTGGIATAAITTVVAMSCAKAIPYYFVVEPRRCLGTAEYLTSPQWKAYDLFSNIMTPLLPFGTILLLNALTVRHIIAANKLRRRLRKSREDQKDSEVENRRKSMILLFALSANFILLWIPKVAYAVNWQLSNYAYQDKYFSSPIYILQVSGFMMQLLSTCTNSCIYGLTLRKFREEFKSGIKWLFALNGLLCKKQERQLDDLQELRLAGFARVTPEIPKELRREYRGCRTGVKRRAEKRRYEPYLPAITTRNVRSLANKMDERAVLSQKEYSERAAR
ncbi:putative G-protein coupled receptor 139 [Rhinoraja longicauda]